MTTAGASGSARCDARDLAERVDAGVGPARPDDPDVSPGQRTQRLEDVPLDRRRSGLYLPAVVGGAVVRQQEGQPGGGRLGVDRAYRPGAAPPISSAICTALVAAPLRS